MKSRKYMIMKQLKFRIMKLKVEIWNFCIGLIKII